MEQLFIYTLAMCMSFLGKLLFKYFRPFLNGVICLLAIELYVFLMYLNINPYQICGLQILSLTQ